MHEFSKFIHDQRMKLLEFAYSDYRNESVEEIKSKLLEFYQTYDVIAANLGSCDVYRVRKIKPGLPHKLASDVWHPPANCVTKIGRANDVKDPVFYCSLFPRTSIDEANIYPGDDFSLAIYALKALGPYEMTSVVIKQAPPYIGNDEFRRLGVELSSFMVKEFTRDVTPECEHFYRRSCAISKILFSMPHKDSIIYPSVKNPEAINIAFRSEAAFSRLRLIEVATCRMDINGELLVLATCLPAKDGSLIRQVRPHPMPAPLNIVEPKLGFSEMYGYDQIATTEKLIDYFKANKQAE